MSPKKKILSPKEKEKMLLLLSDSHVQIETDREVI